jgi:hypothetical protein
MCTTAFYGFHRRRCSRALQRLSNPITTCVAVVVLVLFPCAGLARAQNSSAYTFVLGSGFLCDPSDSSTCPATAKATQGDSYEVSGAGTFDAQDKSVKGAGTFTHKSASGHVLEVGVWTASELVSFASYGIAPPALLHEKAALGPPQFGPKRLTKISSPMPTGGLAVFRILLMPMSGASKTAVLQVNCALGDVPSERSVEGIRLAIDNNGSEFSEETRGRVMFFSIRSEVSRNLTAPEKYKTPDPGSGQTPKN